MKREVSVNEPYLNIISLDEARRLVPVVVGPAEINKIFGTNFSESKCPITFSKKQILDFLKGAREENKIDPPSVVLVLMVPRDGKNCKITYSYLADRFSPERELEFGFQINAGHRALSKDRSTIISDYPNEELKFAWVLCNIEGSKSYVEKTFVQQLRLAKERGEIVFSFTQEVFLQSVVAAITYGWRRGRICYKRTGTDLPWQKKKEKPRGSLHIDVDEMGGIIEISWNTAWESLESFVGGYDGKDQYLACGLIAPIEDNLPVLTRTNRLREKWHSTPVYGFLGMEILDVGTGYAKLKMLVKPEFLNINNTLHGGLLTTLADSAIGVALSSLTEYQIASVEFKPQFFLPAEVGAEVVAVAKIILREEKEVERICNPKDKKLVPAMVEVSDLKSNKLIAIVSSTFVVLPPRQ